MTSAAYLAAKLANTCTRCDAEATDGQHCAKHADAHRDYQRRCIAQKREIYRDHGLCGECGKAPSTTFRCETCSARRKRTSAGVIASPKLA